MLSDKLKAPVLKAPVISQCQKRLQVKLVSGNNTGIYLPVQWYLVTWEGFFFQLVLFILFNYIFTQGMLWCSGLLFFVCVALHCCMLCCWQHSVLTTGLISAWGHQYFWQCDARARLCLSVCVCVHVHKHSLVPLDLLRVQSVCWHLSKFVWLLWRLSGMWRHPLRVAPLLVAQAMRCQGPCFRTAGSRKGMRRLQKICPSLNRPSGQTAWQIDRRREQKSLCRVS